jgi:DNA-binding NarL/FixJ family response regulator
MSTHTNEPIRVLLADDHNLIRDGLAALLADVDGIEIVAHANNGHAVISWLEQIKIDVALLDVNMPHMDGIETAKYIVDHYPQVKTIGLSMSHDENTITKMLKAGVNGYLLKTTNQDELVKAIQTVFAGEAYFSSDVSMIMMSRFMPNKPEGVRQNFAQNVTLTDREMEILEMIASEMTNKEIADKLFISPRTVDTHRRNLLQKLGVKNTAGLVKYAMSIGVEKKG